MVRSDADGMAVLCRNFRCLGTVRQSNNFHHTYALCNLLGRGNICPHSSYRLRLEYFLQQRMTWLMHCPWEPGRVSSSLQHPGAGWWPGCGWWSNLVRTCYNILGDQGGDISSHTEQQPGMLRFPGRQVPEFIFPVIFPPSSHQLGSHT